MQAVDCRPTHCDVIVDTSKTKKEILRILKYLRKERGFDFSGCRPSMLHRRIHRRLDEVICGDIPAYLNYLKNNSGELDSLIDVLTINVSSFFRDPLVFEYLSEKILPVIISEKTQIANSSLRAWSAGCAAGEEPYSMTILLNNLLKKEIRKPDLNIFATDIDKAVINKATAAEYPFDSVKNIKYELLKEYFTKRQDKFVLIPEIRNMVNFSMFDLLDEKRYVPSESIFGDFDIVFCRNVLIYFDLTHQEIIFEKLYRCLAKRGYLVLGVAGVPPRKYSNRFRKVTDCVNIYQKIE